MVLYLWCFECRQCKCWTLLCTRCLRGRRYCSACTAQVRRASVREAGRRYQRTRKGRRSHRRRNRHYRARRRSAPDRGLPRRSEPKADVGTPAASASKMPASAGIAAPHRQAGPQERVTHQSGGPASRLWARVEPAPAVAAMRVTDAHGAEDPNDAKPGAGEVAMATAAGSGETHEQGCDRPEAAGGALAAAAFVAPMGRMGLQPVVARCSCCGRPGEVVFFDGRPAVVRGPDPG